MEKELTVKITAEVDAFKRQVEQAKKQVEGFKKQVDAAGKDVDANMKKLGDSIGKAIRKGVDVAIKALAAFSTAMAAFVTASVKGFADYEQLIGGVNKLFGDASDIVQGYADQAYLTAGLSANAYMEQVTGFSASLISSLGGDTAAAAEIANMAIMDMADNANTFGTDIEQIQSAYQNFAKGNFSLLDNLRLGYSGSREGMQQLIDDANALRVSMGLAGDLTIDSFADIVTAINLVQTDMGIMGTTVDEAMGTISGSIAATKAAWENLLVGLARGDADIPQLVSNVVGSATAVLENIIPVVKQVLENIPVAIAEISPEAGEAMQTICDFMGGAFDTVTEAAKTAFDIVVDAMEFANEHAGLLEAVAVAIGLVVAAIEAYNIGAAIQLAMEAAEVTSLGALITAKLAAAAAGMAALAPYLLIAAAIAAVIAIIVLCVKHWDEIKEKVLEVAEGIKQAVQLMVEDVKAKFEAIKQAISEKVKAAKDTVSNVFNAIKSSISDKVTAARDAVKSAFEAIKTFLSFQGLKDTVSNVFNGIKQAISDKLNAAKDFVKSAIDKIKSFFNFQWSLPHLKLPHLTITGSFNLMPPSTPKFSIDWYAKGGVFEKPTLFSTGSGFAGVGEAGAEAVVPLENNTEWLDRIAERLGAGSSRDIILNIDGKEFARASIDSINGLTRQTGRLALQLI